VSARHIRSLNCSNGKDAPRWGFAIPVIIQIVQRAAVETRKQKEKGIMKELKKKDRMSISFK
jgi:hypothetical protein